MPWASSLHWTYPHVSERLWRGPEGFSVWASRPPEVLDHAEKMGAGLDAAEG